MVLAHNCHGAFRREESWSMRLAGAGRELEPVESRVPAPFLDEIASN